MPIYTLPFFFNLEQLLMEITLRFDLTPELFSHKACEGFTL